MGRSRPTAARRQRPGAGAFVATALSDGVDCILLRRRVDAKFELLTPATEWAIPFTGSLGRGRTLIELEGRSAFLDHFLGEALECWRIGSGRVRSGTWVEAAEQPGARAFDALAFHHAGQALLLIQHLGSAFEDRVQVLQAAREGLLSQEMLEREVERRTTDIRRREEEIALRLLAAAGTRDAETGGHVRRIGLFAAAIGAALGWDAARVADIRIAAPMHDIGKIGIPDAILLKPGRLTAEEYRIMQRHTLIGGEMLAGSEIPLLRMGHDIALGHHEKWNGSGYPAGLEGEAIPLAARIVAIVDVFDAMVSRRVYKPAIPESQVLESMARGSGRDFDPRLFDVFTGLLPIIRAIRESVADE